MVDILKNDSDGSQQINRTEALAGFFSTLRNKGLHPQYFYTDKDFAEINAAKEVGLAIKW